MIGVGVGIPQLAVRQNARGAAAPAIRLSATTIAEDQTTLGTASLNYSFTGTPVWSLADDADGAFQIDSGTGVITVDGGIDFDDDPSLTIEVEVADVDPLPDENPRAFNITITNVLEVTLAALSLDDDSIVEGSPQGTLVGALQDVTSGSSLSLTASAGGRFQLDGENIEAGATALTPGTYEITVRESHDDASAPNPRDSVIEIEVAESVELDEFAGTHVVVLVL